MSTRKKKTFSAKVKSFSYECKRSAATLFGHVKAGCQAQIMRPLVRVQETNKILDMWTENDDQVQSKDIKEKMDMIQAKY